MAGTGRSRDCPLHHRRTVTVILHVSSAPSVIGWRTSEQPDCVRQDVDDSLEVLDATLWTAWRVQNQRRTPCAGNPSAQPAERVHEPHCLCEPWCFPVDDRLRSFWREVAMCEPCAASTHHKTRKASAHLRERCSNRFDTVLGGPSLDDLEPVRLKGCCECCSALVLTRRVDHSIGHGEHLRLKTILRCLASCWVIRHSPTLPAADPALILGCAPHVQSAMLRREPADGVHHDRSPEMTEAKTSADNWIAAFAEALGIAAPDEATVNTLLDMAGVAAHSSERIAAPIACYLIGLTRTEPTEGLEIAAAVGGSERP